VRTNENTKRLLNETRQYAEQMQAQEEEMRQNMEELASTQEEMEKNQQRLDEYRRNLEREVETRTTELKDKESKLAQAISQLQGIIDSGRAGIVALDTNYKIVAANQQSRELIRKLYNTEFEIGQNWFKIFLQEDDRIQAKKLWDRTLGGNHFIHEDKYTDSNGHTTWLEIAFNPILDENKAIIGASMFARDITERKREVKNIQLTANILDNSSSEVYIFNALDLRFVNVNERGRQNLGYTIDELQGLTPCELMLDFSKTEFENFIFPLKAKEIQYLTLESAHRRKDGSSYETALNFQYFEDQDTPLFAAIAQDITERKQNELQLTEALARFNLATAATKEGIWEMSVVATAPINPDNPAWWSRQFKALLGLEQEDFPERLDSWSVRIHPDDREKVLRALYEHLMDITGKTPFQIEYRLMTKGGGYEWFSGSGETLRDIQGNPLKIAGSLRNINRRKKAEDELMEKTAIVNGILNAAVNSIISMDKEDIILTINPATEKMFGYTVDELIGKPIGILLANPEINIKQFTDAVHEIEGKTKEGVIFPLDVSISASEVGDKMIYVGILRTISSRQRG
jgi:PAS domain S-box-containing protein